MNIHILERKWKNKKRFVFIVFVLIAVFLALLLSNAYTFFGLNEIFELNKTANNAEQILIPKEANITQATIAVLLDENLSANSDLAEDNHLVDQENCNSLYKVQSLNVPYSERPLLTSNIKGYYKQNDVVCELMKDADWIRSEKGWIYSKDGVELLANKEANTSSFVLAEVVTTQEVDGTLAMFDKLILDDNTKSVKNYDEMQESKKPESKKPKKSKLTINVNQNTSIEKQIVNLQKNYQSKANLNTALDLAVLYYTKQDYTNSKNWALKANSLNVNNEESWEIFAMSLYKLGQKQEAVKVLSAYINSNFSSRLSILLERIKENKL